MCFSTGFVGWLFCAGDLRYTIGVIHIQIFLGMFFGKQLLDFLLHSRRAGAVDGAVGSVRAVGVDLWRSLVPLVLVSFVALLSLFVFVGQASAAVVKPSAIALTTPSSSPGNDTTPTFTVTVGETGGTVTLYSDSGCTTSNAISSATSVTDTDSPFTVAVTANTLSAGTYTVYAKHTEGGEDSPCSTATASYVLDTTAPTVNTTDTKYYSSVSVDNSGQSPTYVVTFSNANALDAGSVRVTDQYIHARVKFSEDVKGAITNTSGTDRPSIWRVIGSAETQFEVEGQLSAGLEDPAETIGTCTPADGENTPFVTDDWICTYRVKSTDLGKFKIRVKTTTTDAAGNALAQQYDHGTTIQLNKPAAPTAVLPASDTGSSTSDKITKELTKVKVTLPTSASPTTSSTLQIFTYTPASDGSCATPTGSNDGWTSRGTTTGATATGGSPNYVTSTRVWTSNTFTQPSEGKYCFTAQYDIDGSGTSNVASSYVAGVLMELDTTAPTVTAADTKYYSSSTLTTENELANGSYRKQGQNIYTKVKFSENVSNTTANDTTARPSIWYLIGSNETQYDIVAHSATLADGDCKAKSSTDTSEYTCLYTTTSNVNGAFKVRVKTDTKDVAGTALGTQYDHGSTITLDTTAPTVTSADTKYYSNSNLSTELTNGSYRKSGESVYTKVKFSENVANTDANDTTARPSIWYLIGSNETQYDIVAHDATLADGDCKAKSSTDTSEYTCMYTTASNVNGAFKVRVKTTTQDLAANALSTQYDHSNTITLDTTAPTVTGTIATANENTVNSVKYLNANDTITLTLTLTENIQTTNPIVQFKNDANNLGTPITTTGSGTTREAVFTVASGQNVSNGNLKWDITNESSVLDNAGNALVAVAAQDISNTVIDTTPPAAPTALDLAAADDSCADFDGTTGCDFGSNTDDRTSTTTGLSISYRGEEHATVQLSKAKDGGSAAEVGTRSSALASSGAGTTDIALSDGDGVYTVTAKQTDRALNISPASAALDITIDTTAPTAPPTPDLQAASDTGVSSTDNLTKDATVTFDLGSHTNTEECRYVYEGSNVTGQSTYACVAAADDAYTNTTEREESFKTRSYDAAGNHADSATALKVRFDRSITEALIDLKATSDSGYSTTDNITNVTEPTVALSQLESSADPTTGTGKAQVTINLWVDGDIDTVVDKTELTQVGAIANVSSTTQDLQLSALTEAVHKLVAVHTDDAGNEAITAVSKLAYNPADGTKGSNVIIVDTTAPEAPSKPDLSPNRDTYGANANPSRDGTNADDVTYHQDLLFFTEASKRNDGDSQDLTQAALIREQHHLLAYELGEVDTTPTTLVSNLQVASDSRTVTVTATRLVAQRFTTGSDPYALTSVVIGVNRVGDYPITAKLYSVGNNGDPDSAIATIGTVDLNRVSQNENVEITAASPIQLQPNTNYFIHIDVDVNSIDQELMLATDGSEDGGAAASWSIYDKVHSYGNIVNWGTFNTPLKIGIKGYNTNASATSITGQNISGTTHANPTNTAARTIASQQNYHSQTVAGQQHTHRFAGATPDTENQYHIATKQVDAAGNTSDYGPTLSLKIDRKAPNEAPGELILHFDSDTGISMTDRRTANTTPVFITEFPRTRQLEGENTDTDYQVDYYELWRAGLDSNYETEGAFSYPSDSTQNHQASFGLIPDTEDATDQLSDTTSSNPLLDVYEDGISVRIIQQNIPQYNKHYSYKMVSVDLAGNTTLGVDESNPEILVPPPTPSDPDLATASDTGSSTSDNLTKNTTLTLTTSYRNTSTAEQQGQAAQNLRTLELTITPPNNGDPQTLLFSRPADHNDGDGFDIPTGERRTGAGETSVPDTTHTTFTATYSFSTAVDLTQVFGEDLQDGTYTLSFLGINSQGERGLPSNELTVTLDTTPPAFGDNLTLTSQRIYEQSSGANTKHRFEIAATPDTEEGTVVTFHYGTTNTAVLTVTNNIGRTASNASFAEVAITTHSLAEDYTDYEVSLIDAAGNSVPRFAYPDYAKAPRFLSFDTGETNTYILSAYPRNDGTITEPYQATNASGGTCQTTATSTTYTPRSKVTVASATTNACAAAVDSYGNRTIVNISAEKTDLITAAGIHPDDDSTEPGDNLTNNPNPRYHGTTIPGASVRFQTKRSADDWTDAYEQTVTAEDDGSFTIPRVLSTPAGGQRESIFTTTITSGDATGDADPVHGYFSVERSNVGSIVARQAGSASQTSFTHNGFSLELKGVGFRDTAGSSDYFGFCVVADNSKLSIAGLNNVKLFKVFPDPLSIVFRDSDHTITLPLVRDALNSDFTVNAALFGIDLAGEEDPCLVFFSGGSSSLTSSIALLRQHFFTNEGTTFTFSIEPMASGMKTSVDVRAYLTHTDVLGAAELTTPIDLSQLTLDVTPPAVSVALKEPTSSPAADTTPTLTITAEESATVGLYSDAQCSVQVGLSATVAAGERTADLTTAALTDGEYAFYAQGTDVAGNPACTQSALDYTLDTVAPDVTVIQVGTGDTAQYVATAADATTTTARHKDNTTSAVCTVTAGLETDGTLSSGWTAYTGTLVKSNGDNAGSTSDGMCIIFTDAAGNSTAQHIVDGGTYTNSIGGFAISDDTGVLSDDFITNNPSQTLSAVTVPGSAGSLILTNKADTNQVITLPFTASHYSATQPSRFSVSTTIPEGSYTVTAEVTIDNTLVSGIALQDPLIVDTTAPSAPETANPYSLTSSNDTFKVDGVVRAGFTYVSASIGVASAPYSVGSTTQHFLTLFGTDYPCTYSTSQANSGVNESDTFTCSINYTVDATTPQGVAALTMRGEDVAGNAYSFTISDDDAVVYTVDTLAPEYTVTASQTAAKPGDTVTVTVDADDLHDVLLNGSAVSDDNQMRVSFAGEQFSLSTLPGSFDYTVPTDALDGQRTISLPQITDRVGNAAAPTPQGVLFVDTKTPSVSRYLFSNSGTTLSVSAQVARNNHSSMPGEEGVTLSFTGSCSSFPASPVFTASAQAAPERYAYSIRIPRGTYSADTCSLIAKDTVGNQSDPTLTTIPLTITASRSGGGSSGGGGGVGVIKYNVSRGGPPLPEQVGTPLPPEPRAEEVSAAIQPTLTRNLTIGSQGNDVQQLQRYLNNNTCPVAQTGAGSPGQESTYFGQKTQQAVICYQQKHSITPPQGYVGPKTRAHINARISPHQAAPQGIPLTIDSTLPPQTKVTPRNRQAPSFTPTITPQQQPHSLGDRHPDIKEAQELLNERTSCPVAATGPGSPGQETTYFGSLTRQAILCYQRANTLTPTGTLSPSLLSTLRQEPLPQRQQQEEAQDTPQNTNYQPINDPYIYTQRTRRSYTAPSL